MSDPPRDSVRLTLAAELRELRRSLAELEAAEEAARRRRQQILDELDALLERTQHGPADLPEASEVSESEPEPELEAPVAPHSLPRVLIAEDSSTAGRLASRLVERLGYAVDWVRDGVEALESLEQHHYDVVLMDCKMPRMDGYQTTRAIRQLPGEASGVPVIALTANNLEGDDLRCFVAGMDDYLAKPVHVGQLEDRLRHWVEESARRRA